jgi:hypothetical protein
LKNTDSSGASSSHRPINQCQTDAAEDGDPHCIGQGGDDPVVIDERLVEDTKKDQGTVSDHTQELNIRDTAHGGGCTLGGKSFSQYDRREQMPGVSGPISTQGEESVPGINTAH